MLCSQLFNEMYFPANFPSFFVPQAFFISNGEPYPFWTLTFDLVGGLGYPK